MLLQRMTKLLIRYHWMSFGIMTLAMFFVGQWTEEVAEWTSMELRPVINWHKFFGKVLAVFSMVLLAAKGVMVVTGMKRGPRHRGIVWHFIPLSLAYPAMYFTTVLSGETASFLSSITGYEIARGQVFAAHFYIACFLVVETITLSSIFLLKIGYPKKGSKKNE